MSFLHPGWWDLEKFRRGGESRTHIDCRKVGKNCSTREKGKWPKGMYTWAYSPNLPVALPPERPYKCHVHQPCTRGFSSTAWLTLGIMVLLNLCLSDMQKQIALNCSNLHYLRAIMFAHIFIVLGRLYFFTDLSPLRSSLCWMPPFFWLSFKNYLAPAFHRGCKLVLLVCGLSLNFVCGAFGCIQCRLVWAIR